MREACEFCSCFWTKLLTFYVFFYIIIKQYIYFLPWFIKKKLNIFDVKSTRFCIITTVKPEYRESILLQVTGTGKKKNI